MLAKRIIPCLDVKDGRVVKGVNFVNIRDAGDPVENARFYDEQGADELVFLDITASHEKRDIILDVVRKTADEIFMPLTVGGGVRDLDDIRALLNAGSDKVAINTSAVKNPEIVRQAAERFGSQCIVVAIDAKRCRGKAGEPPDWLKDDALVPEEGKDSWEVYTHGGRKPRGLDAVKWARYMEELGAGEILLTSMDRDGTKDGYDIELTRAISEAVNIPVIASGGAGTLEHLYEALALGKAHAVLTASIFHYREYSIGETKEGILKAMDLKVLSDTGAYGEHAFTTTSVCGDKVMSFYNKVIGAKFDGTVVYTNKSSSGAFRGFGKTQGTFAIESTLNELAEELNIDPTELRLKNIIKKGENLMLCTEHEYDDEVRDHFFFCNTCSLFYLFSTHSSHFPSCFIFNFLLSSLCADRI